MSKKIISNFIALLTGQLVSQLFSFFSFIVLARFISVEEFGFLGYQLSVIAIIAKFQEIIPNAVILRDYSELPDKKLLDISLSVRLIFLFLSIVAVNSISFFENYNTGYFLSFNILCLNILASSKLDSLRQNIEVPYKASMQNWLPTLAIILENSIFFVLILLLGLYDSGVFLLFCVIYTSINFIGFIMLVLNLKSKFHYRYAFRLDGSWELVKKGFPIFVFGFVTIIYSQLDYSVLRFFGRENELGLYGAALRLTAPLLFLPGVMIYSIIPIIMQKSDQKTSDSNNLLVNISVKTISIIFSFICFVAFFKGDDLLVLVFGAKYSSAFSALALLMVSQFFLAVIFLLTNIYVGYKNNSAMLNSAIIYTVISLIIMFALVQNYGMDGIAFSKLIGTFISLVYILTIGWKRYGLSYSNKLTGVFTIGFISFISFLMRNESLFIFVLSDFAAMVLLLFLTGVYSSDEKKLLINAVTKIWK